jgi:hypothetical protein
MLTAVPRLLVVRATADTDFLLRDLGAVVGTKA